MSYLSWISDEDLLQVVEPIINRLNRIFDPERDSRIIDPLFLAIEEGFSETQAKDWRKYSIAENILRREAFKIHESLFISLPEWKLINGEESNRFGRPYISGDLINETQKMRAMLRTFSPLSRQGQDIELAKEIAGEHGNYALYWVYLREIYPDRHRESFEKELENTAWKFVTLSQFYEIAFGVPNALESLYMILPYVIKNIQHNLSENPVAYIEPPQIFISYSRKNTDDLIQLKQSLSSHNIDMWTDEHLQPGTEDWQIAIEEQIEASDCIVLILSPQAKKSHWVRRELNYAQYLSTPIIPLWIDGNDSQVAMLNIVTTQRIDARRNDIYQAAIQKLVETVESFKQSSSKD